MVIKRMHPVSVRSPRSAGCQAEQGIFHMPPNPTRLGPAPCVAVFGGCGGAGASTVAAGLARSALHGGRAVVLVDGDPLGGGLETILADDLTTGRHRSELTGGADGPGLSLLTCARPDGAPIPPESMGHALSAMAPKAELIIVDLPRTLGDSTRLAAAYATHSLLVAPVAERALVSAHRMLTQLGQLGPRPGLVARLPARDLLSPQRFAELLRLPLSGVLKAARDRSCVQRASLDRFCERFVNSLFGLVAA
jgi:Mrp family chromosome partitioning ATPase